MISRQFLAAWVVAASIGFGCDATRPAVQLDAEAGRDADPADLSVRDTPLMSIDTGVLGPQDHEIHDFGMSDNGSSAADTGVLGPQDHDDFGRNDNGSNSADTGTRACATANDCDPGEVCLFWDQGCNIQGVCAAMCPLLDACAGCNQHCGCDGVTFSGCASKPFAHRGPCGGTDGGGTD